MRNDIARALLTTALSVVAGTLLLIAVEARAASETEISVTIKDHKFEPAQVKIPASQPIKLTVQNMDPTPEEFESHALKIEKVIGGNGSAVIRIKPLDKGSYSFVGEYHEDTAKGVILAE